MLPKNNFLIYVLSGSLMLFSFSCTHQKKLNEYVQELHQSETINKKFADDHIAVYMNYLPTDFLALREMRISPENINSVSKEAFEAEKKKFSAAYYFELKVMSKKGGNIIEENVRSQQEYSRLMHELNNNMNRYVSLITSEGDTVRSSGYIFTNSYSIGSGIDFIFSYPANELNNYKKFKIVYDDRFFGINAEVPFEYNLRELKDFTKLDL